MLLVVKAGRLAETMGPVREKPAYRFGLAEPGGLPFLSAPSGESNQSKTQPLPPAYSSSSTFQHGPQLLLYHPIQKLQARGTRATSPPACHAPAHREPVHVVPSLPDCFSCDRSSRKCSSRVSGLLLQIYVSLTNDLQIGVNPCSAPLTDPGTASMMHREGLNVAACAINVTRTSYRLLERLSGHISAQNPLLC